MNESQARATAIALMAEFGKRTGLTDPEVAPRRYLWTDAFAVCNYLGLARATKDQDYRALAEKLVDQVHQVLGRYRPDDARSGWISGLDEDEGKRHPTRGGLRIGKPLPERGPNDPLDRQLEWDRDGQYFHYLTKWMHALDQLAHDVHEPQANAWARELAQAAHAGFTYAPAAGGPKQMHWKMSTDLSRALVPSMGHHDPLDGWITYAQLRARMDPASPGPDLKAEIADLVRMCAGRDWTTDDSLGLGGLLADAYRVTQLIQAFDFDGAKLLGSLLDAAATGLSVYASQGDLRAPAAHRLAFRELGLSIGLHALARTGSAVDAAPEAFAKVPQIRSRLDRLREHLALRDDIESFWLDSEHRQATSWREHQDINEVMLATSLMPDGYLVLTAA